MKTSRLIEPHKLLPQPTTKTRMWVKMMNWRRWDQMRRLNRGEFRGGAPKSPNKKDCVWWKSVAKSWLANLGRSCIAMCACRSLKRTNYSLHSLFRSRCSRRIRRLSRGWIGCENCLEVLTQAAQTHSSMWTSRMSINLELTILAKCREITAVATMVINSEPVSQAILISLRLTILSIFR